MVGSHLVFQHIGVLRVGNNTFTLYTTLSITMFRKKLQLEGIGSITFNVSFERAWKISRLAVIHYLIHYFSCEVIRKNMENINC